MKLSLYKFQQVDKINQRTDVDSLEKLLFTTCVVFDKTEYELNNTPKEKALRMIAEVNKIFASDLKAIAGSRIGKYKINYDINTYTFGQYVELNFFLQQPINHAHYILASASGTKDHPKRANYFLRKMIGSVIGALNLITENFISFNNEFKFLFDLDKEQHGEEKKAHPFMVRYGWVYSAGEVAKYEGITLDAAYALPVKQALNDLAYLKSKASFEFEESKKV